MEHQPVVVLKVHIDVKISFKDIKILKVEESKDFCKKCIKFIFKERENSYSIIR